MDLCFKQFVVIGFHCIISIVHKFKMFRAVEVTYKSIGYKKHSLESVPFPIYGVTWQSMLALNYKLQQITFQLTCYKSIHCIQWISID